MVSILLQLGGVIGLAAGACMIWMSIRQGDRLSSLDLLRRLSTARGQLVALSHRGIFDTSLAVPVEDLRDYLGTYGLFCMLNNTDIVIALLDQFSQEAEMNWGQATSYAELAGLAVAVRQQLVKSICNPFVSASGCAKTVTNYLRLIAKTGLYIKDYSPELLHAFETHAAALTDSSLHHLT